MPDYSGLGCRKCGTRLTKFPIHCCNIHYLGPDDCVAAIDRRGHCINRGSETRRETCNTCKGKTQFKIFECSIHGECSLASGATVKHCGTCRDYMRFQRPTTLHCCYHVCALQKSDLWQRNVRQLLKRKDVFTGRRIAAIATGDGIHHPRTVKAEFAGCGFEFIELPNHPVLREVVTFIPMLSMVENEAHNEAVFFAHTKGNCTSGNELGALYWRNAMYHNLLDRVGECMDRLTRYSAVGTHKMIFGKPEKAPYPSKLRHGVWMFAGTFFWFRSDVIFSNPKWRDIPQDRYGAESWLSGLLGPEEGVSMFQPWAEQKYPTPNPYQPELYKQPITDADVVDVKRIGVDFDAISRTPDYYKDIIPRMIGSGHKLYCVFNGGRTWKAVSERLNVYRIDPNMLTPAEGGSDEIDLSFREFAKMVGTKTP